MPTVLCRRKSPRFRPLFSGSSGSSPLDFFLMENLLEARRGSAFPTNGAGPDEDVNVYLVHLLDGFLRGRPDPCVLTGAEPFLLPPGKELPRRLRSEHYRLNGDHRLLMLGLFDRGDIRRRRRVPFGLAAARGRARDLQIGRECYEVAANLLRGRRGAPAGLVNVLEKLSGHFEDYVMVLAALATRRLGLGARLDEADLVALVQSGADPSHPRVAETEAASNRPDRPIDPDALLDLLLEFRATGDPVVWAEVEALASAMGISPEKLSAETA